MVLSWYPLFFTGGESVIRNTWKCLYQVRVIKVFTVFRFLTDFVCLYTYEFWLSLCKIARSSVIFLLPLLSYFLPWYFIIWWYSALLLDQMKISEYPQKTTDLSQVYDRSQVFDLSQVTDMPYVTIKGVTSKLYHRRE